MHINELNPDTSLVRTIDMDSEDTIYLVEEAVDKGLRTIVTTKDPMKARLYTIQEAYKIIYNSLNESEKKYIVEAHVNKDTYSLLSNKLNKKFRVVNTASINYGYTGDVEAEQKLLTALDLEYMYKGEQIITKDVNDL